MRAEHSGRGSNGRAGRPLAMAGLEDHSHIDTPEVTRGKVESSRAVKKLQNGKAAGDNRIVAELVKSGGETMMECANIASLYSTKQFHHSCICTCKYTQWGACDHSM